MQRLFSHYNFKRMSKKTVLIELPYLPSISWFSLVASYENVLLDIHAHYEKGSYRNRCKILGPNGVLMLTVPLQHGKHQHKPLHEVLISNTEPWQKIHWMTLCSCYRRSPYFEYFEDLFQPVYHKKWESIIELNYQLLQIILEYIKVSAKFTFTENYIPASDESIDDKRNYLKPGKVYAPLIEKVENYTQVFSDRFEFQKDLSIFDLLCNKGKYKF